jgi:hypothetical protein
MRQLEAKYTVTAGRKLLVLLRQVVAFELKAEDYWYS